MFPVIHSLLDAKITNVLSLCHDKTILASVQAIIGRVALVFEILLLRMKLFFYLQLFGWGVLYLFDMILDIFDYLLNGYLSFRNE